MILVLRVIVVVEELEEVEVCKLWVLIDHQGIFQWVEGPNLQEWGQMRVRMGLIL